MTPFNALAERKGLFAHHDLFSDFNMVVEKA